jgi:hypothetical protein
MHGDFSFFGCLTQVSLQSDCTGIIINLNIASVCIECTTFEIVYKKKIFQLVADMPQ